MKLLVTILVLLHMNFSMFIPQVNEIDVFDANGQQMEDVNSLVDLINATLHAHKKQPSKKDSDDDNARYFHAAKLGPFFYQPFFSLVKTTEYHSSNYPNLAAPSVAPVFYEIQSPPPKA